MEIIKKCKNKIKLLFQYNDNFCCTIKSLFITLLVCFISYSAFIVNGFVSPDGMLEGAHYYINKGWAIAGCGRWFLALVNMAHANLVFPWLTLIECFLVNWLSAHVLCKILDIKNKWHYYLVCAIFALLPPFIEMSTYTYMVFPYCLSILLSILFVYVNLFNNKALIIISSILLGFAMGAYQSQIGIAVGLTVMCIIKKIIDKDNIISFIVISFISGIGGAIVYILGLNICLKVFNLVLFSRATSFSITGVFSNFFSSFTKGYSSFFLTFDQHILKRNYLFIILFIILILEIVVILVKLIKQKKLIQAIFILALVLLIPPALNFVGIILPSFEITPLMQVPNYIIIPFIIYLLELLVGYQYKIINLVTVLCLTVLSWTYVLSANATFDSYRMSYNVYKTQFSSAMDEVFKLDDYVKNSTRIIVIGRPSDTVLRENISIYNYAINLYHNLLYWETTDLDPFTTNKYIISEFGIDPGLMEYDEYVAFFNLDECLKMPSWPQKGSVKMVNGCAVIKFGEVYE